MKVLKLFSYSIVLFFITSCSNNFIDRNDTVREKLSNLHLNTYNEYYEATLKVNSNTSKQTLELWNNMNLELDIIVKGAGGDASTYSNLRYQIVRRGESFSPNPDSGPEIYHCLNLENCPRKPIQPGEWDIRAIIVYADTSQFGEQTVYSNVVEVDVLYPKIQDIMSQLEVETAIDSIWKASIDNADSTGHQEFGFLVYAEVDVNGAINYVIEMASPGTKVACPERAQLEIQLKDDPPTYNAGGGKFTLAWFHTHPPHTWCENCRETIPSSDYDELISNNNSLPGVLVDFDQVEVCNGHDTDIYYKTESFGPSRRTYQEFVDTP